jgi:hypothetical protein
MLSQVTADVHALAGLLGADVTSSSEEKLGDRFSITCPLSVVLGSWPHCHGPA